MDMIQGNTDIDIKTNAAKLDLFCKQRGTVKKPIREQSYAELKRTHRQFEGMYNKHLDKQENEYRKQILQEKLDEYIANEYYEKCAEISKELNELTTKKRTKKNEQKEVAQPCC
jgi:hypothetical protein